MAAKATGLDHVVPVLRSHDSDTTFADTKHEKTGAAVDVGAAPPIYSQDDGTGEQPVVENAADVVTQVLAVEDDSSVSPWTFRMLFLGIGLSIFSSVLQEIFYFKPQVIYVSTVFLAVISYILGEAMALIPRWGRIGRFLNPGRFNSKEHAAITLMASSAGQSALSTEALAVQQLYYGGYPSHAAGIFATLASQLIGYGIAGMLREVLIRPTNMLYPINVPTSALLQSLHGDKRVTRSRLKLFYIVFAIIFVWQLFPEYFFTVLEGVSIFCLADQNNILFTYLFGGASGNEGLGFLSLCFDWNYIAATTNPLWVPFSTMVNIFIGYLACVVFFIGLYTTNVYRAKDFPFLSQLLFDGSSNSTAYVQYNVTTILNDNFEVDRAKLVTAGIPHVTATYFGNLFVFNAGFIATFCHMLLWYWDDLKAAWDWARPSNLKKLYRNFNWRFWQNTGMTAERAAQIEADPKYDPHYKLMIRLGYREVPLWWWLIILVVSFAVGLACLYPLHSTLPWWGFIIAVIWSAVTILFFVGISGLTGFRFNFQSICQTIAGYMFPGKPLANIWFTSFTYGAYHQSRTLCQDLKLALHCHLSPRATFFSQVLGAIVGSLMNYVIMLSIVENQADILKSIQGSNIWSGAQLQSLNSQAISWSIASDMYSIGARYQWVTIAFLLGFIVPFPQYILYHYWKKLDIFKFLNFSIILWYMGFLNTGVNSSNTVFFIVGFFSQFYLRKYKPVFFTKYNYITAAALDGGTQVLIFILSFAVFGASGVSRPFPIWAGNPDTSLHNLDYCKVDERSLAS